MGISVSSKQPFYILGMKEAPVVTSTGGKKMDNPIGTWLNFNIALPTDLLQRLDTGDQEALVTRQHFRAAFWHAVHISSFAQAQAQLYP